MAEQIPSAALNVPQLWTQQFRHFLMDRSAKDNTLLMDLQFSDADIGYAVERAVSMYNSLPPRCHELSVFNLPSEYYLYAGVAYQLHLSLLMQLQRNDIDYNAGGITVEVDKRRIAHLAQMLPFLRSEFVDLATVHKRTMNMEAAYGAH